MTAVRKIFQKNNFLGGEAGYLLEGRSELPQYQLGAAKLKNFIALKSGGITRRPGTRYVTGTYNNLPARIIPFSVSYDSDVDIYLLEITFDSGLGETYFRVIRQSDLSVYTPTVLGVTATELCESVDDLKEIQFVQSADSLFLCHKNFEPIFLKRLATTPTFVVYAYIDYALTSSRPQEFGMPYMDTNITATTITPSATTGAITLTASTSIFNSGHVGTYFRLYIGATEGFVRITGYTSGTVVSATVMVTLGAASATSVWNEGSWSDYRGWPRTVTFYSQRLIFGGTEFQPDTFWASQSFDYLQMSKFPQTPVVASDPKTLTLSSDKLNQIQWMKGGKKLTIGTSSSEWVGIFTESSTTFETQFDEETSHGSEYVQPKKLSYAVEFVPRGGKAVRELNFSFSADSYIATDLNIFANHIAMPYGRFEDSNTNAAIIQVESQENPFQVYWCIDSYGRLYGVTRDRENQIAAWHSHEIGGRITAVLLGLTGDDYPTIVKSIAVTPYFADKHDRLWMVVEREINGVLQYHVEYMTNIKSYSNLRMGTDKFFLDCCTKQTGASATLWTGYTRFASDTAYVLAYDANGLVQSGSIAVNASGEITLNVAATEVYVGLHSSAENRTLPQEGTNNPEVLPGTNRRIDKVDVRLHQTYGLKVGRGRNYKNAGAEENTTFQTIPFYTSAVGIQKTYTGIKTIAPNTNNDQDATLAMIVDEPWPCTILSVASRMVINDV